MSAEVFGELVQDTLLSNVPVLMPVGGRGMRAREVTHDRVPKPLIELEEGWTILDEIHHGLRQAGFRKFIFCVGHHGQQIVDHLAAGPWIRGVDYEISEEEVLKGPDNAVLQAIDTFKLYGKQALMLPGDIIAPWDELANMNRRHADRGADITVGVTSIARQPEHAGRLVVENASDRLLWCHDQPVDPNDAMDDTQNFTSAAAMAINVDSYVALCREVIGELTKKGVDRTASSDLRDPFLALAIRSSSFIIEAYNTAGEVVDLGTRPNIEYAREAKATFVGK